MSLVRPTAIIAEDEAPQRRELRALLTELWPELDIVAECADGQAAMRAVAYHRPKVAFLDIRMPGVSGLEVARAASAHGQVVLITAYEQHALEAFDGGAVDYLLKPVKRERLQLAISRIQGRLTIGAPPDMAALIDALEARLAASRGSGLKWITASTPKGVKMIPIDEVQFFQAEDKYVRVVTATNEAHIRTALKDLAGQLDADIFWQVHRSVIVRVAAIRAIARDEDGRLRLTLAGRAETLPVSAAFQARFRGM